MTKEEIRVLRIKQVEDFRASGLSLNQWCKLNNLKPSQIRYWLYENKKIPSQNVQFQEVDVDLLDESPIKLTIGRVLMEIYKNFDPNTLRSLILAIKDIC